MSDPPLGPNPTIDPRPDLAEDSGLWSYLLHRVEDPWFWNGLRCVGFRLIQNQRGLILSPTIGNAGTGFETEKDYLDFRVQWLLPRKQEVTDTLRKIGASQKVGA